MEIVILSEAKNQVLIFQFILNRIIKITGWTRLKSKLIQFNHKGHKEFAKNTKSYIGHSEPKVKNQDLRRHGCFASDNMTIILDYSSK
ncbi:MAG: hypothetical protein CVV22_12945 [Ignavibacteriae bacterium HGW-Ignavibacteriae-1]|nr:MAG: hypothetical protein CVV22_12945 [Ignavibacteriae bacterium HGW-Ignavibacteriae-1]